MIIINFIFGLELFEHFYVDLSNIIYPQSRKTKTYTNQPVLLLMSAICHSNVVPKNKFVLQNLHNETILVIDMKVLFDRIIALFK